MIIMMMFLPYHCIEYSVSTRAAASFTIALRLHHHPHPGPPPLLAYLYTAAIVEAQVE